MILTKLCASDEGFSRIPVCCISDETLNLMLQTYDRLFLNGYLSKKLPGLRITVSSRLTSSAGKFLYSKGTFGRMTKAEIRMSSDFLFRLDVGPFMLNGLSAATPQEAFLLVFEHELCHALETALYGQTGHSSRFLSLANGLFGHTKTRHSLPTRKQEAAQSGLHPGSLVSFTFKREKLSGTVTYIGKTATVMVPCPSGEYRDRQGRRYTKYRVPLEQLEIK